MDPRAIIQESLDYIEENLKADLTVSELAEQAGYSHFHYYRLFQTSTGMSVMAYVQRRRLLHGIYAIAMGSTKTDAALCYGFDTYAGFYRAFQREFGVTPSDYLRSRKASRPHRLNLEKEEHMIVTHKKAAEILKHWGLEQEPISDICYENGTPNSNAFYVGSRYILKHTANLGKLRSHAALSHSLAEIGLWAAAPIPTADGREYVADGELYFTLTSRFPGKQLSPAGLYGDMQNARFVGEIIGQLHLALSRCDACVREADLLETVTFWALPRTAEALNLSPGFCHKYLDTFRQLYPQLPRQIIHRDPNPGNILRSEEAWGFIDFELSERNVRIYDPCYAAAAVLSESFGRDNEGWIAIYQNILLGYDSVAKLTLAERQAVPYVLLANQLVCTAWFAEQDEYQNLFSINKAMTLWLIDNFHRLSVE